MRRLVSFLAGLTLILMMALTSIAGPATRTGLFVRALQETVNKQAVGVSDEDLRLFGEETMRYLRGEKEVWEPSIRLYGVENAIAPAFYGHMAQVRSWVEAIPWALGLGAALIAVCLLAGFRRRAFIAGMLSAVVPALLLLLWAAIDFDGFWMILHRFLIPDGIFSAREPVMQLFPLTLFIRYVPYVLAALGFEAAAVSLILYAANKGQKS